jgi:hypothetical protein
MSILSILLSLSSQDVTATLLPDAPWVLKVWIWLPPTAQGGTTNDDTTLLGGDWWWHFSFFLFFQPVMGDAPDICSSRFTM